ncbi:hypothetical protein [Isoptericola sp. NPDC056134]|uniref:hypothetical protein n=1 Tax=Isoptericola sp. NPDC056134 TaxID=3345723 RepID=UPI0035E67C0F
MFSDRRRRRAARRIRPGDGHALQRFRWWQPLSRALFHLDLVGDRGVPERWSVDVRLWGDSDDGDVRARLYRDGVHAATSRLPAELPVTGGVVQVATSSYGLRRCHYVTPDGRERQLAPDPASAEGRRARLERDRPGLSRGIGAVAWVVLAVALVLGVPQIVEQISQVPPVAERFGAFTSPVRLPAGLNVALLVATILASTERALRLRYHWLLDGGLFEGDD